MNRSGSDRLSAYATAAVAVTSGTIASTAAAGVEIVTLQTSLTGPGLIDIYVGLGQAWGFTSNYFRAKIQQGGSPSQLFLYAGSAAGRGSSFVYGGLLGYSATVQTNANFLSGGYAGRLDVGDVKYWGFRLPSDGQYRYGWIELKNVSGVLTVDRWAYETSTNTAIATPAGSTPAVPGLGGLAALACGAAGVRRGRHRA